MQFPSPPLSHSVEEDNVEQKVDYFIPSKKRNTLIRFTRNSYKTIMTIKDVVARNRYLGNTAKVQFAIKKPMMTITV